jgi:importin subunit beta-1
MVVAKVAAIDLPRKEWPTLIQALLANIGAVPPVTGTRQATLEAMGYVCEEMAAQNDEVLTPQEVNMILTAVVAGMSSTEPNESRLAATTALCNAIEFAVHNFENDNERNMLMQVVCQGTQSPEFRIRTASFECLHEIAAMYYHKLPAYMTELYNVTVKAVKEDQEEVALQAIEFWSTICDTEADLQEDPDATCHNFIKAASPHLTPILLEQLTKQEEGQEQDDTGWNISMAAGTCLGLAARVVRSDIVPLVRFSVMCRLRYLEKLPPLSVYLFATSFETSLHDPPFQQKMLTLRLAPPC